MKTSGSAPVRHNANGTYDGIVLGAVAHAPNLIQGSLYHARRDQVVDWIYEDDKGDHGGLTVKLERARNPKQHVDGFHFAD